MLGKSLLAKIAPNFEKVRVVTRDVAKGQAAVGSIGGKDLIFPGDLIMSRS